MILHFTLSAFSRNLSVCLHVSSLVSYRFTAFSCRTRAKYIVIHFVRCEICSFVCEFIAPENVWFNLNISVVVCRVTRCSPDPGHLRNVGCSSNN